MKTKITTLTIIALIILSCNNEKKSTSDTSKDKLETNTETTTETVNVTTKTSSIENTQWILTTLEGNEVHKLDEADQEIQFTLNSNSNRVNGFSGCNNFMGTYIIESGNRIKFSKMASTKKACPVAAIDEAALLNVLEMTDNFTLNNGKLILNTAKIASLAVFKKVETSNQPIVEKYWKLKTLEGQDITMVDKQEREIYFTLKAQDNRVTGFAGCNTFSGEYMLEEGNRIRFENMAVTMKACPDVAINESDYLKVFELADNYTITDDILSLNVARRAPLAVFEVVYFK